MRLAFVQTHPVFGKPAHNIQRALDMMGTRPAQLYVLPELFSTGYQFTGPEEAAHWAEPAQNGPTALALKGFCQANSCHAVAGFAERYGNSMYNASMLVGPEGVIGVYRKVHLFGDEKRCFSPGDLGFPVFDIGQARVGMMICFDWLFPEAARSLALAGADIIAQPVNLVLPYCQDAMVTRCLENGVYAVTANRVGSENRTGSELTFTGQSQVVAPDGKRLICAGPAGEGMQVVDVDIEAARNKAVTLQNHRFDDRRPEQYNASLR